MNCLCCGKPLEENGSSSWHKRCIRRFFGTDELPEIQLDDEALENYALQTVYKGMTVPGVQRKMSMHLSREDKPRLTLVNYPAGYILKPQTSDYPCLPEAEDLAMRLAEQVGVKTVPHALLETDGRFAYITKRVDRIITGNKRVKVKKYAMEDFCQLDGRLTVDKYRGSYERCAKIISRYSSQKGLDLSELFLRLVVSFVTGNSDMHLKNFSMIETEPESRTYILSAAYDLLPVNVLLPEDREEFALTMNGKKRVIRRTDFLKFADECGIPQEAAKRLIGTVLSAQKDFLHMCDESFLREDLKESLKALITARCGRLESVAGI